MQSKAATVSQYLAELPEDRRIAISAVRDVVRANIDADIEERMNYGMIGWVVPHSVYPPGYHVTPKLPLPYAALASQKAYMSLYMSLVYCGSGQDGDPEQNPDLQWLRERWAQTGKKLDMGKGCIRFKKLDDLPLDVLAEAIRRVPTRRYIESYESGLATTRTAKKSAPPTKKPTRAT